MKRTKKLVAMIAVALTLCMAIGGTLAYLTDTTKEVKNTFTIGDVEITLAETKGNVDTEASTDDLEVRKFKIVPGQDVEKDPKVSVDDKSEDCWLFVEITASDDYGTVFSEYEIADGWTQVTGTENVYCRKVLSTDTVRTFSVLKGDKLTVLSTVTNDTLETANPTLTFKAYAIQMDGFEENAAGAWNALKN